MKRSILGILAAGVILIALVSQASASTRVTGPSTTATSTTSTTTPSRPPRTTPPGHTVNPYTCSGNTCTIHGAKLNTYYFMGGPDSSCAENGMIGNYAGVAYAKAQMANGYMCHSQHSLVQAYVQQNGVNQWGWYNCTLSNADPPVIPECYVLPPLRAPWTWQEVFSKTPTTYIIEGYYKLCSNINGALCNYWIITPF